MATKLQVEMVESDGTERVVDLPAKWEICGVCQGQGKSSAHLGAFTQSEWVEQDEDFKQDYMDGAYDRPCDSCKGSGKLLVPDETMCITEDHKLVLEWLHNRARDDAEERSILRAEARLLGEILMNGRGNAIRAEARTGQSSSRQHSSLFHDTLHLAHACELCACAVERDQI